MLFNLSNAYLSNDVLPGCVKSIYDQNEFRKCNFESRLHEHVICFKLVLFGFVTSCIILMLFVSFLDSNIVVYGSVTC